ncbi:tRNA (uridine(34)/cytosine(34)/5-carboxymethylaminomethyluridine(34)-2'-O)-methyltransferase TrmL [Caldisalinibacter kiritimatiensis]|uniref:Putative tRNA (cytidine(34)-2'-O)-methyltransferase n=1 Tax=Caldisalinibacter kiritimatiensis TaxID=1304284 RepID=R1AWQ9_9FIRM|nr:tRNA (uridine(34)/cytosine(34)/5-carboxymethylaminomethyluridine(34)-2'-O)-methyltransferase TrmL [Caldisalinibacter kiritimatiensis]EOD01628.1 tRNA (cytosine34-2'-O-)-methyltransferase [Caldisalinibacter kiritimatiensis]
MALNIVLVEPEIPQNTGNIARTCAATGSSLHLVRPLGFSVDDKYLKRAGLDYWDLLDVHYYDSFDELVEKYGKDKFFYATTKGKYSHAEMEFFDECFLVFGKETAGLPKELLEANKERTMRIPMLKNERARSLNLANSVNIILYEALRQTGFPNLI